MSAVTPAQAVSYLARWAAVADQEIVELREMPISRKLRQLSALFATRALFPPDPAELHELAAVRERWAVIRAAYDDPRAT